MTVSPQWWQAKKYDPGLASDVWTRVTELRTFRRKTNGLDLIYEGIYRGEQVTAGLAGPGGFEAPNIMRNLATRAAPASVNVTKAKVDAICSRNSKHRPFPIISAEDAGWTEKRFARRVSSVLRSKLGKAQNEYDRTLRTRDALLRGTGVVKVIRTERNGKYDVSLERVPRSEVLVSEREAYYGCPRQLFQIRAYPMEILRAHYPEAKRQIENQAVRAGFSDDGWYEWGDSWADGTQQVKVVEAWHLPSGYGAKDGRHVISIADKVLLDEPWTRSRFPFAFLHWTPPIHGMFGDGLVADLCGIQAKINDVNRDIQEALFYGSQLTVFVPRQAKINKDHLRSRHPKVVEYEGAMPQYVAPLPVSPQLFQYLEWLLDICDDISGLSRDFQSGNTQLGASASGRAQLVLDDIQSDRFAMFQLHESLMMVDVGALVIDEARAIAEECPKSEQAAWISEHKWAKVELDEGLYQLKIEPVSFLPGTRAGKLAAIEQYSQAGLISDPTEVLDAMDEPDLQRMNRSRLGPRRAIERVMADLADVDVDLFQLSPDSFFPLEQGIAMARAELDDAWANNAPAEVCDRFRRWIQLADYKLQEMAPPAPSPPAVQGPGGQPPSSGGAMPGDLALAPDMAMAAQAAPADMAMAQGLA